MKVNIKKLSEPEKTSLGIPPKPSEVNGWSVWDCGPSQFNWHYENTEYAYLYQGRVKVRTNEGVVEIKAGDYATFPEGLSCQWEVLEGVVKVYRFERKEHQSNG
jgi:uncharacterized cupin superfamily protein